MSFTPFQYLQILITSTWLLGIGIQVAASLLAVRERTLGAVLMLCGSIVTMLGATAGFTFPFWSNFNGFNKPMVIIQMISATTCFGVLAFSTGFLLHVLRRGSMRARIVELETIIAARDAER